MADLDKLCDKCFLGASCICVCFFIFMSCLPVDNDFVDLQESCQHLQQVSERTMCAYPSSLAQNNTGPITPFGHACSSGRGCTQGKCQTIYGTESCTANIHRTQRGFTCRGGGTYGGVCGLWRQTPWQGLYEDFFSRSRQAWCYVDDKFQKSGTTWDYCHGLQTYDGWAPRQPCIPWNELSRYRNAYGELVTPKSLTQNDSALLCEVNQRYAPSENQWYKQTIPADAGCAIPAFAFLPEGKQTVSRKMLDINDASFTGPFCYTSTSGGPRPVQCDDVCGVKGCNGHGVCSGNRFSHGQLICKCHLGWEGADCSIPVNHSITCNEVRAMGLDDSGEAMLYNMIVAPIFSFRYCFEGVFFWQIFQTDGPMLVKLSMLFFQLGVFAPPVGLLLACCAGDIKIFLLSAGVGLCLIVAPWLCIGPVLGFAMLFFPMLAYLKWWSFDRAILLCVGPIGINWLAVLLIGFCSLGLPFFLPKIKDLMKLKTETMQQYHLDWMIAVSSLFMGWSSLAAARNSALHSTMVAGLVSVGSLQLFSSIMSTITLLGGAGLVFGATSTKNMPIYLVKKHEKGLVFWVAVALVAMQSVFVNFLQVAIALMAPFFLGNFVPDFTLYSGMFSIYGTVDTLNVLRKNVHPYQDEQSSALLQ